MVEVKFEVKVYSEGGGQSYYQYVHGNTNSSGYFSLHIDVPPSGYPILGYMLATISDDGYETIQASGNYSQIGSSIYPAFWVNCIDEDDNGIKDAWELPLAEKFCPYMVLHAADQGVRPVPVEIMDRNGDKKLGWEDILVEVHLAADLTYVGQYTLNRILYYPVGNFTIEGWYPKLLPRDKIAGKVDSDGDGSFNDESTHIFLLYSHFEWGKIGYTNPSNWYSTWHDKMGENPSYHDGTTYAHFFMHGNEVVIQYYFFYPFNACHNRHESEWEHINVIINSQNPSTASIQRVEYYFHHRYMNCYTPGVDYYVVGGTHPKVYVGGHICTEFCGEGSHGSYPKAKSWLNIRANVDEGVHGDGLHINFDEYKNIIILPEPETVDRDSELGWLHYKGFWGHIVSTPSSFAVPWSFVNAFFEFLLVEDILEGLGFPENAGNIALLGPAYQKSWNDIGPNSGHDIYP